LQLSLFLGRKSVSIGSLPACHKAGQSNIRLTCVCAFADAQSGGKVGVKLAVPYRHIEQVL